MIKPRLLVLCLCLAHPGAGSTADPALAQEEKVEVTPADRAWQDIQPLILNGQAIIGLAGHKPLISGVDIPDIYAQALRERGLKFYGENPLDPRRLEWLPYAIVRQPLYQTNRMEVMRERIRTAGKSAPEPVYDEAAKAEWAKVYPKLREEFFASPHSSVTGKALLRIGELSTEVRALKRAEGDDEPLTAATAEGEQLRERFRREIIDIGSLPADWAHIESITSRSSTNLRFQSEELVSASWIAGEGAPAFIQALLSSQDPRVRDLASGKNRLLQLTREPMQARFTAIDGRKVDLAKLRGKVVLIQCWATGCTGCIGEIPTLSKVYEKYHGKGFEILGYSFDKDPALVPKLLQRRNLSAPWPHRVDSNLRQDYKAYGFLWVSNLLLLDKQGKLVSHSAFLSENQLETLVRKYLAI
jgi:thiol-disulfide isomerase/thioredoxin